VGSDKQDTTNAGAVTYDITVPTVLEIVSPATRDEVVNQFLVNQTGFLSTFGGDFVGKTPL